MLWGPGPPGRLCALLCGPQAWTRPTVALTLGMEIYKYSRQDSWSRATAVLHDMVLIWYSRDITGYRNMANDIWFGIAFYTPTTGHWHKGSRLDTISWQLVLCFVSVLCDSFGLISFVSWFCESCKGRHLIIHNQGFYEQSPWKQDTDNWKLVFVQCSLKAISGQN